MAPSKQDTASVADDVSMADAPAGSVQHDDDDLLADTSEPRIRVVSLAYSKDYKGI